MVVDPNRLGLVCEWPPEIPVELFPKGSSVRATVGCATAILQAWALVGRLRSGTDGIRFQNP